MTRGRSGRLFSLLAAVPAVYGLALLAGRPGALSFWRTDDREGAKAGEERTIGGVRFCWAPTGRFRMGSPAGEAGRRADEGPADVAITRGFWAGKYEVTQGQWKALIGAFPQPQDTRGVLALADRRNGQTREGDRAS
jgi:formylglycine-generating enzyme required for sulfatase activity